MKINWIEVGKEYFLKPEEKSERTGSLTANKSLGGNNNTQWDISREFKAWLDGAGRLRTSGPLHVDKSYFEILICLGASPKEIEKHIGPICHPNAWEQWTGERKRTWD